MNGEAATPSGEATLLRVLLVELKGPARDEYLIG